MFNPFNFGARPTPSIPKVFVLRTAALHTAHEQRDLRHPMLNCAWTELRYHLVTMPVRSLWRSAALMLRSHCHMRFTHYEGHNYPA
jgi:hypothetical protein